MLRFWMLVSFCVACAAPTYSPGSEEKADETSGPRPYDDSCGFVDEICDDGSLGGEVYCELGTDCTDCGNCDQFHPATAGDPTDSVTDTATNPYGDLCPEGQTGEQCLANLMAADLGTETASMEHRDLESYYSSEFGNHISPVGVASAEVPLIAGTEGLGDVEVPSIEMIDLRDYYGLNGPTQGGVPKNEQVPLMACVGGALAYATMETIAYAAPRGAAAILFAAATPIPGDEILVTAGTAAVMIGGTFILSVWGLYECFRPMVAAVGQMLWDAWWQSGTILMMAKSIGKAIGQALTTTGSATGFGRGPRCRCSFREWNGMSPPSDCGDRVLLQMSGPPRSDCGSEIRGSLSAQGMQHCSPYLGHCNYHGR